MKEHCGAKTRSAGRCRKQAGWGTDHLGQGRCRLHGGSSLVKHGRHSMIIRASIRELAEAFEADPDPLDLLPELAQARALYVDYVNRSAVDPNLWDPGVAAKLLAEVGKTVKRIEDVRSQNAISQADFYRVLMEMGRVVDGVITDQDQRERIHEGWLGIRVT